jgi:hypothetical protein
VSADAAGTHLDRAERQIDEYGTELFRHALHAARAELAAARGDTRVASASCARPSMARERSRGWPSPSAWRPGSTAARLNRRRRSERRERP